MKQIHPLIIGVSGISGAGKSALIKQLAEVLHATTIYWDDFDEISTGPEDYIKWHASSKNYEDWVYNDLAATLEKLKAGQSVMCPATHRQLQPTKYVLFDAPLGYCHKSTGKHIDLLVCLDTPLDIALARRLLRDYKKDSKPEKILEELKHYLAHARPLFILSPEEKQCDLLIDGSLPINEQCQKVLAILQNATQENQPKKISISTQPLTQDLKEWVYSGFSRHAIATTGHDEKLDAVAFVAKDHGVLVGAVVVQSFWGALHVKYVYIEDKFRDHGIATELMEHALAYGRNNHCPFAFVETMSFQALGFYQKMGFELEFTRSGYKYDTSFHYLRKDL